MTSRIARTLLPLFALFFLSACGSSNQPPCEVAGATFQYGETISTDECGGCVCTSGAKVACTETSCTPTSVGAPGSSQPTGGWGSSEYYCCCKSGCPKGSGACISACLVFGGACKDLDSPIRLKCAGSNPTKGCTCSPDNSAGSNGDDKSKTPAKSTSKPSDKTPVN